MPLTEAEVRRLLPMRGGNMSSDDIDFFIEVARQWVAGYASAATVDTPMGEAAATLRAGSLAQYQLDAGSGNRNSTKAKDLAEMAKTILDGLDEIAAKAGSDEDDPFIYNPDPPSSWPTRDSGIASPFYKDGELVFPTWWINE